MKTTTGKPILGGILGALAALVFILILTFGAILPPTQLVVWTLLGLGVLVGALMLTVVIKSVKFITVAVIAIIMIAWGAAGIPAHNANGELTGGCNLQGYSFDAFGGPLDAATPDETSVRDPFEIDTYGTIEWEGNTPGAFEGWTGELFVDFGGFNVRVWRNGDPNPGLDPDEMGVVDNAEYVESIEDATGAQFAGLVLLGGYITSPDGTCDMTAWIYAPSDGLFAGTLLIVLWVIFTIIVLTLIILMIPVCRIRKGLGGAASAAVVAAGGTATNADAAAKAVDEAADDAEATVNDAADSAKDAVAAKKPAAKKPAAKKPAAKKPTPKKK